MDIIELSQAGAIFFALFAAGLCGSWYLTIKYMRGYPVSGFMFWLYVASFVLVGIVYLFAAPHLMPEGLAAALSGKAGLAWTVLVCGGLMAVGLQIQMFIMEKVGLILPNSIAATIGIFLGTAVTAIVGKLPANLSISMVIIAAILLLAASIICQYSGVLRDKAFAKKNAKKTDFRYIPLLILSQLLITTYPYGLAKGIQTELNPGGFPPILCVAILVVGSFSFTLVFCTIMFTVRKEWKQVFFPEKKLPILMGLISGVCHYAGNLLNIFAGAVASVAAAFLLGRTSSMWTYLWGLLFGEYKGAGKKTYVVLFVGIGLYIGGVVLLTFGMYR